MLQGLEGSDLLPELLALLGIGYRIIEQPFEQAGSLCGSGGNRPVAPFLEQGQRAVFRSDQRAGGNSHCRKGDIGRPALVEHPVSLQRHARGIDRHHEQRKTRCFAALPGGARGHQQVGGPGRGNHHLLLARQHPAIAGPMRGHGDGRQVIAEPRFAQRHGQPHVAGHDAADQVRCTRRMAGQQRRTLEQRFGQRFGHQRAAHRLHHHQLVQPIAIAAHRLGQADAQHPEVLRQAVPEFRPPARLAAQGRDPGGMIVHLGKQAIQSAAQLLLFFARFELHNLPHWYSALDASCYRTGPDAIERNAGWNWP